MKIKLKTNNAFKKSDSLNKLIDKFSFPSVSRISKNTPQKMSEMGLEPTQISPYAPETYVSTIPPLRHEIVFIILLYHKI